MFVKAYQRYLSLSEKVSNDYMSIEGTCHYKIKMKDKDENKDEDETEIKNVINAFFFQEVTR